jgi:hypothetical protein
MQGEQKFVDEVRHGIIDTVILAKALGGNVTKDNVEREVRNLNIEMGDVDVNECITHLEETGHLRIENNKLTVTDDGKEDVQKVLPWFRQVTQQVGTVGPRMGAGGNR